MAFMPREVLLHQDRLHLDHDIPHNLLYPTIALIAKIGPPSNLPTPCISDHHTHMQKT